MASVTICLTQMYVAHVRWIPILISWNYVILVVQKCW